MSRNTARRHGSTAAVADARTPGRRERAAAKRAQESGRSFADAFTAHGSSFPVAAQEAPKVKDDVKFPLMGHHRGVFRPGYGWSATRRLPLRVYRATTDQVGGVFPFLTPISLPPTGVPMGLNVATGGGFYVDPVRWVREGYVSNPNILIFGKPGMGKSTTVKALTRRAIRYGGRVMIAGDLKDEYELLCREFGVEPIALGLGLSARLNPLDAGPLAAGWESLSATTRLSRLQDIRGRWLVLLAALLGAQGVEVTASVRSALAAVLDDIVGANRGTMSTAPDVTIPMVFQALRDPNEDVVRHTRYRDQDHMREALRPAVDGLNSLVNGVLRGLFDDHTTVRVDWEAPIQSMSLKRLKPLGDEAIAIALTCVNSWSRGMTDTESSGQIRYMIRDECWRQMRLGVHAVKSLDSDLRLSRDERMVQVMVMHKPSDLGAVGDAGTQEAAIAKDLWALCDTKILLAQEQRVAQEIQDQIGLSNEETAAIYKWSWGKKGRALWRVGDLSFRVQTLQTDYERELFDTNQELVTVPRTGAGMVAV